MGLLLGQVYHDRATQRNVSVVWGISSQLRAHTENKHVRVEISPEETARAADDAEKLSTQLGFADFFSSSSQVFFHLSYQSFSC